MALIYITGIAGSGKTTVLAEIQRRGYEVHDADEQLSYWANKSTGLKIDDSNHTLTTDPAFFDEHDWNIDKYGIERLANDANKKNEAIFICGSVVNENDVWHYFTHTFCLYVDDDSLAYRLLNRTEKEFGKADHELNHVLALNRKVQEKYTQLGATIIDATKSTSDIADEIIRHS